MTLILITYFLLIAPDNYFDKTEGTIGQNSIVSTCSPLDFLKLKDKKLQDDFFIQLDSIRRVQYPNGQEDTNILVDLTRQRLNQFLKDIDKETLEKTGQFEHSYHFNIAPPGFTDAEACKDKISIRFFSETCEYRMVIDNVFRGEPDDCMGGAQVVYGFKIDNDKMIGFGRQAAG